jgi:hypothetical protein
VATPDRGDSALVCAPLDHHENVREMDQVIRWIKLTDNAHPTNLRCSAFNQRNPDFTGKWISDAKDVY